MDIFGIIGWGLNIFTWMIPSPQKSIERHWQLRKVRKRNKALDTLLKSNETRSIVSLGIGAPYTHKDIKASEEKRFVFCPIPQEYVQSLGEKGFCQYAKKKKDFYLEGNNCLDDSFWAVEQLKDAYESIGKTWDKDAKEELISLSRLVANDFNEGLHAKTPKKWFNGIIYGVKSFEPGKNEDESENASISFYKTDYFTFQVFAKYYENHKAEFMQKTPIMDFIHSWSIPFLSSFGVSVLAIVSSNEISASLDKSDLVVIVKRSENVRSDQQKWHFTMNEAIIPGDKGDLKISSSVFRRCATRGFQEEVNWDNDDSFQFSSFLFTDFLYSSEFCQMGLTGLLKISVQGELSKDKSMEKAKDFMIERYVRARDQSLESTDIKFLPIKEIPYFIDKHSESISASLLYALNSLLIRFDSIDFK